MKSIERDKFLTEAMGECKHELGSFQIGLNIIVGCKKCKLERSKCVSTDFSSWEGFGKLWEWCKKQEWWKVWRGTRYASYELWCWDGNTCYLRENFLHPDTFADAVYVYLKGKVQ
jgi:hypothetical protein